MVRPNKVTTPKKHPKATAENPHPCLVCELNAEEKSIQCSLCKFWCHFQCAGIDGDTSVNYVKNKKLHWFCSSCEPHAISLLDRMKIIESNNTKFAKDLSSGLKNLATSVDTKIENVKLLVNNSKGSQVDENLETKIVEKVEEKLKEKLEEIKKTYADALQTSSTINTSVTNMQNDVTTAVTASFDAKIENLKKDLNVSAPTREKVSLEEIRSEAREVLEEKDRIDKKKCNLIFSNIKESNSIENDEAAVMAIIKDKLHIQEDVNIKSVARLGNRLIPDKPRLVKVVFESLHQKKLVLRRATQMRNLEDNDIYANVYIRPDLTKQQIETSKNLSAELKNTRENQPGKWVIRKGLIINLNERPQNRRNEHL